MLTKIEYQKQYYIKNKDKIKAYAKKYHLDNLEYHKQYYKNYYLNNKEKYFYKYKYNLEYYREHKEQIQKYYKKYYNDNKDKYPDIAKKWRGNNPDRARENRRKWKKNNPEKYKAIRQRKYIKRITKEKEIINTLTSQEWLNILKEYGYKCAYCGCEFNEDILPTRDHVIPISKGGHNTKENVVPACIICNSKKWTKIIQSYQLSFY